MDWAAECCCCRFKILSPDRGLVKKLALKHKKKSGHRIFITGQLCQKEVQNRLVSGRTFLTAVGELI